MSGLGAAFPWHAWDDTVGAAGSTRIGAGGPLLGAFTAGGTAVLDVVRAQGATVAAFADVPVAVVLALRVRAAGARVFVRDDDAAWQAAAMATRDRLPVTVLAADDDLPSVPGTFARPVVVFETADVTGAARRPVPPWSVRFLLPREVSFATLSAARTVDLVLFGRLTHQQSALVASTWRLPAQAAHAFRQLRRWQLGVVTPARHAVVDLELSPDELQVQASATALRHRAERIRGETPRRHRGASGG